MADEQKDKKDAAKKTPKSSAAKAEGKAPAKKEAKGAASGKGAKAKADGESKPKAKAKAKPKAKAAGKEKAAKAEAKGKAKAKAKGKDKGEAKAKGGKKAAAAEKGPARRAAEPAPPLVRASARYVRVAPRKARLVADQVRGLHIEQARAVLDFSPRNVARDIRKLIDSAAANAENNHDLDGDEMRIASITVDEGPTLRRWRPRALGRATPINKRTSHISVALEPTE